jgi:Tfp pilus assembly protein PilF
MRAFLGAAALALVAASGAAAQVPELALDAFPPISREPIGRALADARAHPEEAERAGRLAMLLHAWEQWEAAAQAYGHARRLEQRADWWYLGGIVEARMGRHAEAAPLLARAVELAPTLPARLKLADAYFESGAVEESERLYAALAQEPAAEPHARYGLGRVHAARGRHEEAVEALEAAVALYPEYGAAWYSLGLSLRKIGRLDDARTALARAKEHGARWPGLPDPVLEKVEALRDDASARLARGLALERTGDLAGATREHEAAVAADPSFGQAHVNLISLYGRQRDWTRAEAHYRAAVALGSGLAEAHYNYGVLLLLQDRVAEAEPVFEQAVAANPQHAAAWHNLGQIAERRGDLAAAATRYRRAVEEAPADDGMRFNLGRMLIALRQWRDAIAQFEVLAAREGAERPRYVYGLATALVLSGDLEKGRRIAADARALAEARGQRALVAAIDRDLAKLP